MLEKAYPIDPRGFVESIGRCAGLDEMEALCVAEIERLRVGRMLSSVRGALTKYRNTLRTVDPNHPALRFMRLSDEEMEGLKRDYINRVHARNEVRQPVAGDLMQRIIAGGEALLKASTIGGLGLGILVLTGRRPVEVFKTGSFAVVDEQTLLFSGQAKKRGRGDGAYEIPYIGADAGALVAAVARLRLLKDCTNMSEDLVNKSIGSKLTKDFCRRMLGLPAGTALGPKDFRALYAQYCYDMFAPTGSSRTVYFSQILGHEPPTMNPADAYMRYSLD